MTEAGQPEGSDLGELAMSEVVTNAVLHAHTSIDVTIAVFDDRVCCEVRDGSCLMPRGRGYDEQASTGRGLDLVAALASAYGVESFGDYGKVVWFCIGPDGAPTEREVWAIDASPQPPPSLGGTTVLLKGLPPTLWLAARQHHDAQLRELALYAAEHAVEVDFGQVDRARMTISECVVRAVDDAQTEGRAKSILPAGHPSPLPEVPSDLDLELDVASEDATGFLALPDALDLAERLSISGHLLAHPGLPEIIAIRDWACEQVVAQLAGSPAGAWPGTAHERFETATHAPAMVDESAWDSASVRDADYGVVAADDANRILAISRPLAAAVGWEPSALVGRRVVTLIPPRLREAHVAGFSRHLSTGEANVLGVPLELPVLRADGAEMMCRFMIEKVAAGAARSVYIAWIEPIG